MKRLGSMMVLVVLVVAGVLAGPVLAASLGISPSQIELDVPAEGSSIVHLKAHYFRGDIKVTLVDIPLRVEPETIHVDALAEPVDIQITIYGDPSLGSQMYDGYIKFLGMSGEMIAIAVQVRAKVTNIVEGQPLPEEPPAEEAPPSEAAAPTPSLAGEPQSAAQNTPPVTPASQEQSGGIAGLPLNTVIIIGAGLVFIGLVALAISLAVRRPKY